MWPPWVNVTFGRDELRKELATALGAAWEEYRALNETLYAFGLYVVSEDGWIVGSACATEESTFARSSQYAIMLSGDDRARAEVIRWWDADWVHAADLRPLFQRSNELLKALARDQDAYLDARENGEVRRRRAAVAAFEAEREALYVEAVAGCSGSFGQLVLGVFGGDPARTARSIERLNPPDRVARWRAEVEQGDRAYAALQL